MNWNNKVHLACFLIHVLKYIIKEVYVVIWGLRDKMASDFLAVSQQENTKSRNTISLSGFAVAIAVEC